MQINKHFNITTCFWKWKQPKNHLGFYIQNMYINSLLENIFQKCRSVNVFNNATNSSFRKGNIKHNLNHSLGLKIYQLEKVSQLLSTILDASVIFTSIIPKWHLCNCFFLKSHLESDDLALCHHFYFTKHPYFPFLSFLFFPSPLLPSLSSFLPFSPPHHPKLCIW